MSNCEFLKINDWWVPGVSGEPVETPVVIGNAERSAGGLLRMDLVGVARSWRVDLVRLSGVDADRLRDELLSPAPHLVEFGGESFDAMVTYTRRVVPDFGSGDLWRSDFSLTIEELGVRR